MSSPLITNRTKYRILEIIPASLVWLTLTLAVLLSFIHPLWAIYFIILFDLYWLIRISYFVTNLFISWKRFRKEVKIDWWQKVRALKGWQKIYHLIILPTYKDEIEVLETTFNALCQSTYPFSKFIVVLAGEERDKERFEKNAEIIRKEYSNKFYRLLITLHPKDLPNEIPGKGSNTHFAGRKAEELIDKLKIPYENIIVSCFDIDSCIHPQYFSCLTYKYLTSSKPTRTSFQPLALYNNNIWDSPSFARVVANSTTFWLMTEMARPERLFTFSSHSMSFKALVEVGFWQKDIVNEDSRIFLQCFLRYDGDYRVTPMYIPVSMDTVLGKNIWQTIEGQYKQMRRWAWSVEHFPYTVVNFSKNKKIPWGKKIKYLFNQSEGQYSWATAPLLILILGYLPLYIASSYEYTSVIVQSAPFILETLMRIAMIGLFVCAILNILLLPSRPPKYKWYKYLAMFFQWLLLPLTMIIFGSFPAIDAQTRLMLGKRMGFWLTKKVRK